MAITCFRIFNNNLIDEEILANTYVSSENSSFPVSNAYNKQRRSKIWRSEGYFNITSSNGTIIFRETIGIDLKVSIPIGEYTSITDLAAEIKNQLENIGGSSYTITQENLRWKFVSNGGGGGGIFELRWSDVDFTMDSILGITSDKTGALSYVMDEIVIHESEFITWDLGTALNPECFIVIGGDRNSSIQLSPGSTLKIQGNSTNAWGSPEYSKLITYDDEVLSQFSDTGLHTEQLRYWRLSIIDSKNPNGYVSIGAFFLGGFMSPSRGRAFFPLNQEYIDRSVTVFAEGGQTFSDIKPKTQKFNVSIGAIQKEDVEEWDAFFLDVGTSKPFFISMDTDEVWSSDKNRRIVFVQFSQAPRYNFTSPNYFTMNLSFSEAL